MGIDIFQKRALEQASIVKKSTESLSMFFPKNFVEQLAFNNKSLYALVGDEWIQATMPHYSGYFSIPTNAETVSVTGLGFKPKTIKVTIRGITSGDIGVGGYGFATSLSNQKCFPWSMEDTNSFTSITASSRLITIFVQTNTVYPYAIMTASAELTSLDDDGFTLYWRDLRDRHGSTYPIDVSGDIIYEAWG